MSWVARLDAHVNGWPALWRGLYLLVKWGLVAFGAFLWVMLWWQRSPVIGIGQIALFVVISLRHRGLL